MAQIEKRGDRYKITVYLGKDGDGKRKYKRTTFRPEGTTPAEIDKEVKRYADQFEILAKNGGIMDGRDMTVRQFAEDIWKPWMDFQRDKKLTRMTYEEILRIRVYPEIGTMKMSAVTPLHIQAIVDKIHQKGLSVSTMKNAVIATSSIFACAMKKHVLDDNPCDFRRIDIPEKKRDDDKLHYFTAEQAMDFLASLDGPMTVEYPEAVWKDGRVMPARTEERQVNPQWKSYFHLAIFGGFRRGELVALKWSDIDFQEKTVTIRRAARNTREGIVIKSPKTSAGCRTIVLPDICFSHLRELQASRKVISPEGWVFVQQDGLTMMWPDSPGHFFKRHLQQYNKSHPQDPLPAIRLHDLRHTQATLLLAYGADIETVRKRMGHSKASVTLDIYGHAMEEMDRSASDLLGKLLGNKRPG